MCRRRREAEGVRGGEQAGAEAGRVGLVDTSAPDLSIDEVVQLLMIEIQRLKATRTALWCGALVMSMTALAFASVPLYDLFCRMTGFGGTPGGQWSNRAVNAVNASSFSLLRIAISAGVVASIRFSSKSNVCAIPIIPTTLGSC